MSQVERWPSGRRRTPGKCVGGKPSRGFESLPLRHLPLRKRSPDPAAAGFFRCFRGLWERLFPRNLGVCGSRIFSKMTEEILIKKSKFSDAQITAILKQAENGVRFLICAASTA